jgi:hypothetical protein
VNSFRNTNLIFLFNMCHKVLNLMFIYQPGVSTKTTLFLADMRYGFFPALVLMS